MRKEWCVWRVKTCIGVDARASARGAALRTA
jgi:hypothetical protein